MHTSMHTHTCSHMHTYVHTNTHTHTHTTRVAAYQKSLVKALGRTLDDGRFTFVVMDAPNIRLDDFRDVLAAAQVSLQQEVFS